MMHCAHSCVIITTFFFFKSYWTLIFHLQLLWSFDKPMQFLVINRYSASILPSQLRFCHWFISYWISWKAFFGIRSLGHDLPNKIARILYDLSSSWLMRDLQNCRPVALSFCGPRFVS